MYFFAAAFLHAFNTYMFAYIAGVWYFTDYDEDQIKMLDYSTPCCRSITLCPAGCNLLRKAFWAGLKQTGSLGIGALIMAICKMLAFLCKWAKKHPEEAAQNPVIKCI